MPAQQLASLQESRLATDRPSPPAGISTAHAAATSSSGSAASGRQRAMTAVKNRPGGRPG